MIKKVKITNIHTVDMYYAVRDGIIGTVITLDISEDQFMKGWYSSTMNRSIMQDKKGDFSGMCFTAIQFEEIP